MTVNGADVEVHDRHAKTPLLWVLREIPHPDQMALCRRGHSGNKPFCDGTHLTIDFDGTLANRRSRQEAARL
jgi:CDGSH-type Zn-finger protein